MSLKHPEALLLLIPLGVVWYHYFRSRPRSNRFQLVVLLLLVLALSMPVVTGFRDGVDLWVLIDRSESISADARKDIQETLTRIRKAKSPGSRLGEVEFAGERFVARRPGGAETGRESTELDTKQTDLHGALQQVLGLRDPARPTRLLVLSDGLYTTEDPLPLGMWARSYSIPIDYRFQGRPSVADTSVLELSVPSEVRKREPFQFSGWIQSVTSTRVSYQLKRDNQVLAEGTREVQPGKNRWLFRDELTSTGIHRYTLSIEPEIDDRRPENNRNVAAVRVRGKQGVLVVQSRKQSDQFVASLKEAGIPVEHRSVQNAFQSRTDLDSYRCVVLENVSGSKLGRDRMVMLRNWVKHLGGNLLMTGGERSFARGGYMKSPLEEVLPVSMELKEEKRRRNASVAIVLDRSGSMAADVGGGRKKMDLANIAAVESMNLLNDSDEIAVIATDSQAHVPVSMTKLKNNRTPIEETILSIQPGGGGIFVKNGMEAAARELMKGRGASRHIILFADARDSEQKKGVVDQVKKWNDAGITVSVVGLGSSSDVDAPFLERIAKQGNGKIHFTNDPKDLPRIFVEDVTQTIRKTFVKEETPLRTTADIRMMTNQNLDDPPPVEGFNVTRRRKKASVPLQVLSKKDRPALGIWNHGLGRAAALTIEVDGDYTGPFRDWSRYQSFMSLLVRWLLSANQEEDVSASFQREGSLGRITISLDPERDTAVVGPEPVAYISTPGTGGMKTVPLNWRGPDTLRATVNLKEEGIYLGSVDLGDGTYVDLPPLGMGYSPEYRPDTSISSMRQSGKEVLQQLAEISGGEERINLTRAYDTSHTASAERSLVLPLLVVALLLFVLEIAWRRLRIDSWIQRAGLLRAPRAMLRNVLSGFQVLVRRIRRGFGREGRPSTRREPSQEEQKRETEEDDVTDAAPDRESRDRSEKEEDTSTGDVFGRAKDRARRRLDDEDEEE